MKKKPTKKVAKRRIIPTRVRNRDVVSNLGLVHRVAQQYKQFCNKRSFTYDDLFQEGVLGLIIARDKYNPEIGAFSTYANFWIRAKILRALERYSSTIHVTFSASATYHELVKKYGKLGDMIEDLLEKIRIEKNKGKITEKEYTKFVEVLHAKSPDNYNHITIGESVDLAHTDSSSPIAADSRKGAMDLIDHLAAPEKTEGVVDKKVLIHNVLKKLLPEERKLVALYYGLEGEKPHTYKQLAKIFKKTKQVTHMWHAKVTLKMRRRLLKMCEIDGLDFKELFGE
jgi:RNA polymerase sigma factor (sigma-70 family)